MYSDLIWVVLQIRVPVYVGPQNGTLIKKDSIRDPSLENAIASFCLASFVGVKAFLLRGFELDVEGFAAFGSKGASYRGRSN